MKKTRRSSQVADVIRSELSLILQRELNDPDLGFLSVTDVEVSADLRYAKVFVSSLNKPKDRKKSLQVLQHAAGRIRYLLAQHANLRFTPELDFRLDETAERAATIDQLLQKVKTEEEDR